MLDPKFNSFAFQLRKTIYTLKQAPKQWPEKFKNFVLTLGIALSNADFCVFLRDNKSGRVFILVYVDHFIIATSNSEIRNELELSLAKEFEIAILG